MVNLSQTKGILYLISCIPHTMAAVGKYLDNLLEFMVNEPHLTIAIDLVMRQ